MVCGSEELSRLSRLQKARKYLECRQLAYDSNVGNVNLKRFLECLKQYEVE